MVAPPGIVWRQRQYPENTPDPIIENPAAEKSSMPAVVLDQEKTDQERARRHADGKGQPVADRMRPHSRHPKHDKGYASYDELEHTSRMIGYAVPCQRFRQVTGRRWVALGRCVCLQSIRSMGSPTKCLEQLIRLFCVDQNERDAAGLGAAVDIAERGGDASDCRFCHCPATPCHGGCPPFLPSPRGCRRRPF